jgi:hypothetical protein
MSFVFMVFFRISKRTIPPANMGVREAFRGSSPDTFPG